MSEDELNEKKQELIERGRRVLAPTKIARWIGEVENSEVEPNYWMHNLELKMNLIEMLESGAPIEEVKRMFSEQDYFDPETPIDVRDRVRIHSERGREFFESTAWGEENGINKEQDNKSRMYDCMDQGYDFIYDARRDDWEVEVQHFSMGTNYVRAVEYVIALMEKLENGASIEEAKKMFDEQEHSVISAEIVRYMMFNYAKQGPEFYEATARVELSEEMKKKISDKKEENAKLNATEVVVETPSERKRLENEIESLASSKSQLELQIINIEKQLEELRKKEAQLAQNLGDKQNQLKELDEK